MSKATWRARSLRRLRRHLLKTQSPRFHMAAVLVLSGLVGFIASATMLHFGWQTMWLRYPAAAVVAYAFFLLLVNITITAYAYRERVDLLEMSDLIPEPPEGVVLDSAPELSGDGGLDLGLDGLDGDEGCLIVALAALVLGLLFISGYIVATAPTLLAELLLDSLLVGGLYGRMKKSGTESLVSCSFRRTRGLAAMTIVLLALAGAGLQSYAPEAASIGPVLEKWLGVSR